MNTIKPPSENNHDSAPKLPLHHQVSKGGFWILALRLAQQLLATGRILILAFFLSPGDFGLLAIALLTLAAMTTFTQLGFRTALVQRKGEVTSYLNTAWTIGLIRAVILSGLLIGSAAWLIPVFDGAARFKENQIKNLEILCTKLQVGSEPSVNYVRNSLSESTRELLKQAESADKIVPQMESILTEDFNRIISDQRLNHEPEFSALLTSDRAGKLARQYTDLSDQERVNRLLLEETFIDEIKMVLIDRRTAALILQILAATFILAALGNIGTIYFQKELEFHRQFAWQIAGTIIDFIVSVALAWRYETVWALVAGRLSREIMQFYFSYRLHPFRPRLCFDKTKILELWHFGKWILTAGILTFILNKSADIFITQMISAIALGYFYMAQKLSRDIITEISTIIYQVTFPAYAKIQDNIERLRQAYLKALRFSVSISLLPVGLIIVLAEDFVRLFMKSSFTPIIPIMQILAILGMVQSLSSTSGPIFPAIGRPKITTKLQIIKFIFLAVLLYPLTKLWGLPGAAWALTGSSIAIQPFLMFVIKKIIHCRYIQLILATTPPLVAMLIMCSVILLTKTAFSQITIPVFLLLVAAGTSTYLIIMYVFYRFFGYRIKNIFQEQIKGVLRKSN